MPARRRRKPPTAVIDTNVVISYLFGGATVTTLIDSLGRESFIPVMSSAMEQEFVRTISHPRISKRVDISDDDLGRAHIQGYASEAA